jgi:hypothetical protein
MPRATERQHADNPAIRDGDAIRFGMTSVKRSDLSVSKNQIGAGLCSFFLSWACSQLRRTRVIDGITTQVSNATMQTLKMLPGPDSTARSCRT